jgi:hypothetical protein
LLFEAAPQPRRRRGLVRFEGFAGVMVGMEDLVAQPGRLYYHDGDCGIRYSGTRPEVSTIVGISSRRRGNSRTENYLTAILNLVVINDCKVSFFIGCQVSHCGL